MKNYIPRFNLERCLKLSLALLFCVLLGTLILGGGQAFAQAPDFGPNVTIITPGMTEAQIEQTLTNLSGETEFSTNRYSVLFQPGTYTVQAPIGYYESISGLAQNPGGVTINGFITPNFGAWSTWCTGNCPQVPLTTYFWRSIENMTINAATDTPQGGGPNTLQWGVSQGNAFRRMQVNGALELTNSYCGSASGGFLADTAVTGQVNSCSQQQWFSRNSNFGSWSGGVWNMVFSGVNGSPTPNYPVNSFTVLPTTPVSREKPFLYVDSNGNYFVFSPSVLTASSGTSWSATAPGPGTSLAISTFFIAKPSNTLADINNALNSGKNLILTPGIYQYSGAITVTNPNTVVLGLGYATLVPQTGTPAITVADVDGVQIAGLLIDAGPSNSPVLLQVGTGANTGVRHNANPTSISDVFFRIGGSTLGTATESLEVDSDDVILDNIWAWRADHGNPGTTGWAANTAANGLVVNGDYVTATGLVVEHYQGNQVLWNGNYGQTIFYESEAPYDVPSQASWMSGTADSPVNGYPSYSVAANVTNHTTYGLGVYSNFNQGVPIVEDSGINFPNAVGAVAIDSVSVFLGGSGAITDTINNVGTPVNSSNGTNYVPFFQGAPCSSTCPSAPTNLTATFSAIPNTQIGQISLAWTPGTTPNAMYTIYRGSLSGFKPSVSNQLVAGLTSATTAFVDTTVTSGSNYYYLVQAQTMGGTSLSNQASAGVPATGGVISTETLAINAGGSAIPGTAWVADEYYNNGLATATDTNVVIPATLTNAAPQAVYDSNRWGAPMTYIIPGFAAGQTYIVNLHFDDNWYTTPGQRIFNVAINGVQVLNNFDIVATAGAHTATVQSFSTTADSTGTITVAFTAIKDNPAICGIEIGTGTLYGSPSGPTPPIQPTGLTATLVPPSGALISAGEVELSWNASPTPGVTYGVFRSTSNNFTPSATTQIAAGLSASSTTYQDSTVGGSTVYYYLVQAVSADGSSAINSNQASVTTPVLEVLVSDVININAGDPTSIGGVTIPGSLGVAWIPDTDFVGGGTAADGAVAIPVGLTNAAPLQIYQTNRYGNATYTIPGLTAGASYIVNLHFEENYWPTAGSRIFNVSINGEPALTNFDIVAAAGANHTANVQSFNATADSTGTITIAFVSVKDNALVCGIEVGIGGYAGSPVGPNPPGQPTALTALAITSGEVDLSWNPSITPGVTYSVFRSTTGGFTPSAATQLTTGLTTTTYKDTSVTGATTYYYVVQAVASDGVSTINSNQASATTPVSGGEILVDIIDLNAGGGPVNGTLGVNWVADTPYVQPGSGSAAQNQVLITIPSTLVNAAPEAIYQSNRTGASTWIIPGFTPGQMYIVALHFEESWFTTTGSRTFNVSINGIQVLKNFDIVAVTGNKNIATVQSFAIPADSNGNISVSTSVVVNAPLLCGIEIGTGVVGVIPAAPTTFTATPVSSSEIDLGWSASATPNVTYSVFGSTNSAFVPGPTNQLASGLTALTYNDTGLTSATTYYYAVEALGGLVPSGAAETSAATLPPACTTLPSVPGSISANTASDTEIDLAWSPSTAPVGCDVTYNVYRGSTSGFAPSSGNLLTSSSLLEPFYSDISLTASTIYYYVVEAVDEAGSSAASAQGSATTLATGGTLWTQVWGDDFNGAAGTTYDHTKWWNEIAVNTGNQWGDSTIQSTSDSLQNVYQDGNGHLVEAMTYNPTPASGQTTYTSARLHSVQNIGYGKIEASIQNPSAPGMGAAFWALGTDIYAPGTHNTTGGTPWPWSGELDMMELQSSNPGHNGSTIHGGETDSGTNYEYMGISATMDLPKGVPNFDQGFHTVTTLWGPYHVQYFMDGVQYGDVSLSNLGVQDIWPLMGPSDNYTINLILSSGIGGNGGTPGTTGFPSNYTFDYVHYSTLTSGAPSPVTALTAPQVYSNAVQLNWTASPTSGVTYNIYQSTNPNAKLDLSTLVEQNASGTSFLAGGLNPGTKYYFWVLASNWGGESTGTAISATTSPVGNSTGLQLSAGGYAIGSYLTSQYVLGGNTNYHFGNVVDTSQVTNPAPAGVYLTERWAAAAWTITGLNPGTGYNVRLHFVEAAHTAVGQRAFNVSINSATVLNNFDIFQAAGGQNKAITQEFYTLADENGIIELQTQYGNSAVTGIDLNPTVSAIEIIPIDTNNPPAGPVVGAAPGTTTDLAIASGAPTGVAGTNYVADEDFNGGDSNAPYPVTTAITLNANSAPAGVYQYERYVPFTYILTGLIADSPYTVSLHFAETYWDGPGDRIFNVAINGNTVLPNLDVYKAAGGEDISYDPQFTANADMYGQIILQFMYGGADQPFINGLEVTQSTAPAAPVAPTNLGATATSTSQINLSWTASTTTGAQYLVFRSTTSGFTPSASNQITPTAISATAFSDTGLTASTAYYYVVEATNSNGTSSASNQATATTMNPAPVVPAAPTNLGATATSTSQINLSWTASTTTGAQYLVFRSTTSGFTASASNQITLNAISATTFNDTGLSASTTYYYVVEATNSNGNSAASNQASATTSSAPVESFTLAVAPTALTLTAGTSGTETVTVTPVNGFPTNSTVNFACSSLPANATCSFSSNTVNPAGNIVSTLTVSTTKTSAAIHPQSRPFFPGSALAIALCFIGWKKRRGVLLVLLALISLFGLALFTGCGGGSSKAPGTSVSPVTSIVTVTATSGALQQTSTFTLTVQ